MKTYLFLYKLMLVALCGLVNLPMAAQVAGGGITVGGYPVSQTEAFNVLQTNFPEEEVDYYLMDGYSLSEWTFFVDADPKASWTHTCYVATVPKTKAAFATSPVVRLSERTYPPEASYIPLKLIQKGPSWKHTDIPSSELTISQLDNPHKNNIYAIILHGDKHPNNDIQDNRNDCSFIYTTLTKKYQIPKDNIYPLLYDITVSTRTESYGLFDLDGDKKGEIHSNVFNFEYLRDAISEISNKIHEGDMFFSFCNWCRRL